MKIRAFTLLAILLVFLIETSSLYAQVCITFDPPPPGQIAPPQNVRATTCPCPNTISASLANSRIGTADAPALAGFNVYRVPEPPEGQPPPTCDQIVGDPNNLIGKLPPTATCFTDMVSTGQSSNFIYGLTSFYANGQMSGGGCPPFSTDLPVIKNPTFRQGTIFIDAAGSFIAPNGALLIIDDKESFPLQFDSSTGAFFTVPKQTPSTPGGFKIKKLIKKGIPVRLVVKNPDGKVSVGVIFTRK